jgi:hypothetical protein
MKRFAKKMMLFAAIVGLIPIESFAAKLPYYRLNLEQCFEIALTNNEEIKAAEHDVEIIVAKKIEATKRYVPVTNYKYRAGPAPRDVDDMLESVGNFDLSVFQSFKIETGAPVSTFGRLKIAKTLADMGVDLKTLEMQKKADEILLNIYKLYNGVLLARELKGLLQQGLDAIQSKIGDLEKEESADQIEILKLKVLLYEAERR